MKDFVPDFSLYLNNLISYVKKILNVKISVKMYDDILAERYLIEFDPVTEASHSCRYCRAVQELNTEKRCAKEEINQDESKILKIRKPFIRKCFAGVSEAIIPFFYNDELSAVIKLGQCRISGTDLPILDFVSDEDKISLTKWYYDLPEISEEILLKSAQLIDYALKVIRWDNFTPPEDFSEFNITAVKAKNLIDTYTWKKDFSVSSVAGELNVTPEHLCRIFSKKYNRTIMDYLLDTKIKRAKFLLLNTSSSIQKISDKCGFSDANYFSRSFKKRVGLPPSEYRKNATKEDCNEF